MAALLLEAFSSISDCLALKSSAWLDWTFSYLCVTSVAGYAFLLPLVISLCVGLGLGRWLGFLPRIAIRLSPLHMARLTLAGLWRVRRIAGSACLVCVRLRIQTPVVSEPIAAL